MGDGVLVRTSQATGPPGELELSDTELVKAARRDRAAFAPLYARYVDRVYRASLRRLGSREGAEDATAQTFMKALVALPTYREDAGSFRSWLFAIAHNVMVDTERARRTVDGLDAAVSLPDPGPEPDAKVVTTEGRHEVRALLLAVAPDQRRVLELRLAGLTTPEIARALDRSPGAVRATQFRAMARLRSLMGLGPSEREQLDA